MLAKRRLGQYKDGIDGLEFGKSLYHIRDDYPIFLYESHRHRVRRAYSLKKLRILRSYRVGWGISRPHKGDEGFFFPSGYLSGLAHRTIEINLNHLFTDCV
ncbi:hypothetical protein H6F97_14980 [Microcoleus sp. FACHB-1]|nr:hypothetical protein [Microcoleus sp. FACHB-1]